MPVTYLLPHLASHWPASLCRQRDALGQAADVHARLQRASLWLEGLSGAPSAQEGGEKCPDTSNDPRGGTGPTASEASSSSFEGVLTCPQGMATKWMVAQGVGLTRLSVLVREQAMLLAAVRDAAAIPGSQQTQARRDRSIPLSYDRGGGILLVGSG